MKQMSLHWKWCWRNWGRWLFRFLNHQGKGLNKYLKKKKIPVVEGEITNSAHIIEDLEIRNKEWGVQTKEAHMRASSRPWYTTDPNRGHSYGEQVTFPAQQHKKSSKMKTGDKNDETVRVSEDDEAAESEDVCWWCYAEKQEEDSSLSTSCSRGCSRSCLRRSSTTTNYSWRRLRLFSCTKTSKEE